MDPNDRQPDKGHNGKGKQPAEDQDAARRQEQHGHMSAEGFDEDQQNRAPTLDTESGLGIDNLRLLEPHDYNDRLFAGPIHSTQEEGLGLDETLYQLDNGTFGSSTDNRFNQQGYPAAGPSREYASPEIQFPFERDPSTPPDSNTPSAAPNGQSQPPTTNSSNPPPNDNDFTRYVDPSRLFMDETYQLPSTFYSDLSSRLQSVPQLDQPNQPQSMPQPDQLGHSQSMRTYAGEFNAIPSDVQHHEDTQTDRTSFEVHQEGPSQPQNGATDSTPSVPVRVNTDHAQDAPTNFTPTGPVDTNTHEPYDMQNYNLNDFEEITYDNIELRQDVSPDDTSFEPIQTDEVREEPRHRVHNHPTFSTPVHTNTEQHQETEVDTSSLHPALHPAFFELNEPARRLFPEGMSGGRPSREDEMSMSRELNALITSHDDAEVANTVPGYSLGSPYHVRDPGNSRESPFHVRDDTPKPSIAESSLPSISRGRGRRRSIITERLSRVKKSMSRARQGRGRGRGRGTPGRFLVNENEEALIQELEKLQSGSQPRHVASGRGRSFPTGQQRSQPSGITPSQGFQQANAREQQHSAGNVSNPAHGPSSTQEPRRPYGTFTPAAPIPRTAPSSQPTGFQQGVQQVTQHQPQTSQVPEASKSGFGAPSRDFNGSQPMGSQQSAPTRGPRSDYSSQSLAASLWQRQRRQAFNMGGTSTNNFAQASASSTHANTQPSTQQRVTSQGFQAQGTTSQQTQPAVPQVSASRPHEPDRFQLGTPDYCSIARRAADGYMEESGRSPEVEYFATLLPEHERLRNVFRQEAQIGNDLVNQLRWLRGALCLLQVNATAQLIPDQFHNGLTDGSHLLQYEPEMPQEINWPQGVLGTDQARVQRNVDALQKSRTLRFAQVLQQNIMHHVHDDIAHFSHDLNMMRTRNMRRTIMIRTLRGVFRVECDRQKTKGHEN